MAVIKCSLEKGKLKVGKVQFQPGDIIELDEPVEVSWRLEGGMKPIMVRVKCMTVMTAFAENERFINYVIPIPCPH